jgi:hypothetical protein
VSHLEGASLRFATFDSKTQLRNATLGEPRSVWAHILRRQPEWGNTLLGDVRWDGPPDLTQVRWDSLQRLGDETGIDWRTPSIRTPAIRVNGTDHRAVVRAYRQVATQLRAQGLSEEADRFGERAQIRKRKQTFREILEDWRRPWRLPWDVLRWLFSWLLAVLAGYGYHPERSVFWYLATIAGFAYAYYAVGHGSYIAGSSTPLIPGPLDAVVFSMTSFHGRGFFPNESIPLHHPLTVLAAFEAVVGLFIEISIIATFTQRFLGK